MKLRVQHENKDVEILMLREPLLIREGNHLNCITDGAGMDYWFTQDGYYDGWGRDFPTPYLTEEETNILVEEIEKHRIIESVH